MCSEERLGTKISIRVSMNSIELAFTFQIREKN